MKTLSKIVLSATAAASVLAAVPASAQSFGHYDASDRGRGRAEQVRTRTVVRQDVRQMGRQQVRQNQFQARRWNRGERFDSRYAQNYRVITNPRAYRLHDAPRGYRWVQSGNDAVLVAVASGLIGAIIGNSF
jgi:Ni/Co efflux regulator RcnB